jgi:hypothetical protein
MNTRSLYQTCLHLLISSDLQRELQDSSSDCIVAHSEDIGRENSQQIQWCIFYVGTGTEPPNIETKLEATAKVGDNDGFFVARRHNPGSPGPQTSWSPLNQELAQLQRH